MSVAGSRAVWVACALCWLVLMGLLADRLANEPNTLARNGLWEVGKLRLQPPPMGAARFENDRQALAGSRLNLGAWHGHHELIHRHRIEAVNTEFDFRLGRDTYLLLLFEMHREQPRHALRLSSARDRPSAWLRLAPGGQFLDRYPLAIPPFRDAQWHRARVRVERGEAALLVDGQVAARWPADGVGNRIGFRSGPRDVTVDNVNVFDHSGIEVLHESFSPRRAWGRAHGLLLLAGLVLPWATYRILLRRTGAPRAAAGWLLALHWWALVGVAVLLVAAPRMIGLRYPAAEDLRAREDAMIERATAAVSAKLAADFSEPKGARELRVLFLGTSQTDGSGARSWEHGFVSILERRLALEAPPDWTVRTLRGAVSGSDSTRLTPVFLDAWLEREPDLVVVNLGCNDQDVEALEANIGRIAEGCAARDCRVLLVQEAMSAEQDRAVRDGQRVVGATARRLGLPVVDADGAMAALGDVGLLWWDIVHPTDFGHEMLAEILWPHVHGLIEEIAAKRAVQSTGQ
jgi:lysophospholipase L1-like esterase